MDISEEIMEILENVTDISENVAEISAIKLDSFFDFQRRAAPHRWKSQTIAKPLNKLGGNSSQNSAVKSSIFPINPASIFPMNPASIFTINPASRVS